MINVYCSNKMIKFIGKDQLSDDRFSFLLGSWNAHVFYLNRKKWLYFYDRSTGYSILIPHVRKEHLESLGQIFAQRLLDQLSYDGLTFSTKLIKLVTTNIHPLNYIKTDNNRTGIGTMNRFIQDLKFILSYEEEEMTLQSFNQRLTDNMVRFPGNKKDYFFPIKLMQKKIEELEG